MTSSIINRPFSPCTRTFFVGLRLKLPVREEIYHAKAQRRKEERGPADDTDGEKVVCLNGKVFPALIDCDAFCVVVNCEFSIRQQHSAK